MSLEEEEEEVESLIEDFIYILQDSNDIGDYTEESNEELIDIIDDPLFDVDDNITIDGIEEPILFWVSNFLNVEIVKYILDKGVNINKIDYENDNVLLFLLNLYNNGFFYLIQTIDIPEGKTLINNFTMIFDMLLIYGADINYVNPITNNSVFKLINKIKPSKNTYVNDEMKILKDKILRLKPVRKDIIDEEELKENVSEETVRQIREVMRSPRLQDLSALSPRYNQKGYKLCWAFAFGRILFRFIFKAIAYGICKSNIQLGKQYLKTNAFTRYTNTIDTIRTFTRIFTEKEINYLFTYTSDYKRTFKKEEMFKDIRDEIIDNLREIGLDETTELETNPFFVRQLLILNFIIIFLIGIKSDFNTDKSMYNIGNVIKNQEELTLFIQKFMYFDFNTTYINEEIIAFFNDFGYSYNLVKYISKFLVNLKLQELNININFSLISKEKDIILAKHVFEEARKQGLYLLLSFSNINKLLYNENSISSSAHLMYAIPIDNKKFLLKNSWGDSDTDKIIYFEDLLEYESLIKIYSLLFDNIPKKIIKYTFSKKKRISLRDPISKNALLKKNSRIARSLSLTEKTKKKRHSSIQNPQKRTLRSSFKRNSYNQ
jgi:hypothetical protein